MLTKFTIKINRSNHSGQRTELHLNHSSRVQTSIFYTTKNSFMLFSPQLINLLRVLLENCVNSGLDDYIRQLFFISNDNNHNEKQLLDSDLYQPNDSLLTLFTLAGGSDDLIGSAALDLLNELVRIVSRTVLTSDFVLSLLYDVFLKKQ